MQLTSLSECKHVHASFTFKAKFIEDNDTMDSAIAHTRYLPQPRSARPRSKKGGAAIKQGEQGLARSQVPLRHSAAFLLSKRLYRHPASRIRLSWNFRKSTGDPPAIKHFSGWNMPWKIFHCHVSMGRLETLGNYDFGDMLVEIPGNTAITIRIH